MKISSKYLNIEGLSALIEASKNKSNFDGVLLMTSNGMVIGKLAPVFSETDIPTAAELVYDYKESYMDACVNNNKDVEVIGDGSLLVVKDALIKQGNMPFIKIDELTLHCTDIIGFSPINIEEFTKQF